MGKKLAGIETEDVGVPKADISFNKALRDVNSLVSFKSLTRYNINLQFSLTVRLDLGFCSVNADGISQISSLANLNHLGLRNNALLSFEPIVNLPNLTLLDLRSNNISVIPLGISSLLENSPSAHKLSAFFPKVSQSHSEYD